MNKNKAKWNIAKPLTLLMVLMVITMCLTACQQQRYLIVVFNNSEQPIKQVTLRFENQSFEYGTINVDSKRTGVFEQHRMTSNIKISWRNPNNQEFEQQFATFDHIPSNYDNGRVHLKLNNNSRFELSFDDTQFED